MRRPLRGVRPARAADHQERNPVNTASAPEATGAEALRVRETLTALYGYVRPHRWTVVLGLFLALAVTNTAPTRPSVALPSARHGLIGLKERAELLHGTLTAEPPHGAATRSNCAPPPGPTDPDRTSTRHPARRPHEPQPRPTPTAAEASSRPAGWVAVRDPADGGGVHEPVRGLQEVGPGLGGGPGSRSTPQRRTPMRGPPASPSLFYGTTSPGSFSRGDAVGRVTPLPGRRGAVRRRRTGRSRRCFPVLRSTRPAGRRGARTR
ncbi:hypothetical protein SAMN05428939_1669 [Streptomyces sp. TLI_105]|nr:hypothetical protein SAMN05428939_1669 [Streptomyces sp. TLI_105]